MNYILRANSLLKEKHIPCVYTYYDELTIILRLMIKSFTFINITDQGLYSKFLNLQNNIQK